MENPTTGLYLHLISKFKYNLTSPVSDNKLTCYIISQITIESFSYHTLTEDVRLCLNLDIKWDKPPSGSLFNYYRVKAIISSLIDLKS